MFSMGVMLVCLGARLVCLSARLTIKVSFAIETNLTPVASPPTSHPPHPQSSCTTCLALGFQ